MRATATRRAGAIALAAAMLALYAPVLVGMAGDWWRNESASHSFLVPFIVGYLVWQKRRLVTASHKPWPKGLALVVAGLLLYPLGLLGSVEFLPQVSLLVVLTGLALYSLGPKATKGFAFPLAFLWFMVPWPDTLVEFMSFPMQLASAKLATMLAGLAGMAVAREGVDIHVSSYTFSVGAPCSGMNSLVALMALAALIAYLLSGPGWRRWALFAAGVPLALMANVLRIATILAIATIWGPKVAEGFFHGFSGVVVFMLAALGLAGTGRALRLRYRLREEPEAAALVPAGSASEGGKAPSVLPGSGESWLGWRASLAPLALVLVTLALVAAWGSPEPTRRWARSDLSRVPLNLGQWQGQDLGPLDQQTLDMLRPEAYMRRAYVRRDGYPVEVFALLGHAKDTFHSPGLCLPGSGWNIVRKSLLLVEPGAGGPFQANEFRLDRQGQRQVVLYWYVSHAETTPSWVVFQYRLLRNRMLGRPSGGALIRLTIPEGSSEELAVEVARELMRALGNHLREAMAL